jgi:ADP-ribosyl-[dinitrogen reductase] hydrolase
VSIAQAHVTHHHPLSDAATVGIGRLLRALLLGTPWAEVTACADTWVQQVPAFQFRPYPGRASGYVVDTVQTVLHAFCAHDDFEQALITTVNQGDDADTTGALVGMLAGARCGARALPRRWLRRLAPAVVQAVTNQASELVSSAHARWGAWPQP